MTRDFSVIQPARRGIGIAVKRASLDWYASPGGMLDAIEKAEPWPEEDGNE